MDGPASLIQSDVELFRGGVPQVADWVNAWRACRTPVSFRSAEKFGITADFLYSTRKRSAVSRRAFRSMVLVMSSVLRRRKRDILRGSGAIAVSLDDRAAYRLLRFKCQVSRPPAMDPEIVLMAQPR